MWVETGRGWHGTWPYESHFCLNFECLWVHFCLKVCVYLLPSVPQTHSTSTAVLGLSTGYVRQHGKNYSEILRLTIDLLLVVGSQASGPHISAIIFHAGEAIFAGHAEGTQRNNIIITQICFDVIMMYYCIMWPLGGRRCLFGLRWDTSKLSAQVSMECTRMFCTKFQKSWPCRELCPSCTVLVDVVGPAEISAPQRSSHRWRFLLSQLSPLVAHCCVPMIALHGLHYWYHSQKSLGIEKFISVLYWQDP